MAANSTAGGAVSIVVLALVIVTTVTARRIPPAVFTVPAAVLVIAIGLTDVSAARAEIAFMGPAIGFLAAMLVVADICS